MTAGGPMAPGRSLAFEVDDLRARLDLGSQGHLSSFHFDGVRVGAAVDGDAQPRVVHVAILGGDSEPFRSIDGRIAILVTAQP
jgi:hypothetical protein